MKSRRSPQPLSETTHPAALPDAASLAALRAWYEGVPASEAVARYLGLDKIPGQSSRGMLGAIRRQLCAFARSRHRADLAEALEHPEAERARQARAVAHAIDALRTSAAPVPLIGDDVGLWLPPRVVSALRAEGIHTLAALTVRIPRRRRWWVAVKGLGATGARQVEAFFAEHSDLTERARALVVTNPPPGVSPWEQLVVPGQVDGSQGTFRAPRGSSTLAASNDYEAVQAWLQLHESPATQRTYRKEAERLMLWAILERGRALSSLTTEDATTYRAFLRRPTPRERWVGPARPRGSAEWRPFVGALAPKSVAHALSVLGALFRWLVEQRYVLANPFAGIKVRGATRSTPLDATRVFSVGEWTLVRTIADGPEWSYGWVESAAQRLRFVLDFGYATGLRASVLVGATLGAVETDAHGDHWLHLVGKGSKPGKLVLPPLARSALDRYLAQRGLPTTRMHWNPATPIIAQLSQDRGGAITGIRLWAVMHRFFETAAELVDKQSPTLAEKLRRASPHWMRHTHATHALAHGAELTTVRDNLWHASISTTSVYLHGDDAKRASQLGSAFAMPRS